jgi:MFS family permease
MSRASTRTRVRPDLETPPGDGPGGGRRAEDGGEGGGPLRRPGFRRLLLGGLLSTIGGEMQAVAVGWVLYRRTGSAAALGLVGLTQIIPILLLAVPIGVAADRHSRKNLLLLVQMLMAMTSLGLAILVTRRGPVPLIYACLLLGGAGVAMHKPARWSLISGLVTTRQLGEAITWYSGGMQLASMLGPALGGLVLAAAGAGSVFLVDVLAGVVVLALLAPIRAARGPRVAEPLSGESILSGFRFIWRTKLILATLVLDLFAVLLGGATALLPIFADEILHVGPSGLGWLRAAPSIGAALMSLGLAYGPPLRRTGPVLLGSVAGFGAATVVFGLSRSSLLSFAMLLLVGRWTISASSSAPRWCSGSRPTRSAAGSRRSRACSSALPTSWAPSSPAWRPSSWARSPRSSSAGSVRSRSRWLSPGPGPRCAPWGRWTGSPNRAERRGRRPRGLAPAPPQGRSVLMTKAAQ